MAVFSQYLNSETTSLARTMAGTLTIMPLGTGMDMEGGHGPVSPHMSAENGIRVAGEPPNGDQSETVPLLRITGTKKKSENAQGPDDSEVDLESRPLAPMTFPLHLRSYHCSQIPTFSQAGPSPRDGGDGASITSKR